VGRKYSYTFALKILNYMKKMINFKSMAMIVAMILSMTVVSCVPEPEGPEQSGPSTESTTKSEIVSGVVNFNVLLSEGVLNLYDVKAVVKIDNEVKEDSLTGNSWFMNLYLGKNNPSKVSCEVVATAKSQLPEFTEPSLTIAIKESSYVNVVRKDGKTESLNPSLDYGYQESTLTISSDKAQEYVAKRPTLNIMNVEYVIE
jgi:hypothetical protein